MARVQKGLRSAALLVAAGLLAQSFAGCAEQDASIPEVEDSTFAYSKELSVTDGANTIVLRLSANDLSKLDDFDAESFELNALFEYPEGASSEAPFVEDADQGEAVTDALESVLIDEVLVDLEPGAVGYGLRIAPRTVNKSTLGCTSPVSIESSYDFAEVDVSSGSSCAEVKISTKDKFGWWKQQAYNPAVCAGNSFSGGKANKHRLKLEICPGPTYTHSFYN
jgi:hypothetical protein